MAFNPGIRSSKIEIYPTYEIIFPLQIKEDKFKNIWIATMQSSFINLINFRARKIFTANRFQNIIKNVLAY